LKQIKTKKALPMSMQPGELISEAVKKESEKPISDLYKDLAKHSSELVFLQS
jgi:hypothetical protein